MCILREIIGSEAPEDEPQLPDIEDCRPDFCPSCKIAARERGVLWIIGHGSYKRWSNLPEGAQRRIRRFRCKRCGRTTNVLPHWLLPRFQYTAPLILLSLLRYYVRGETAAAVTGEFALSQVKQGWATLRRWGAGFLRHAALWGSLGKRLGVPEEEAWSRERVRVYLERFLANFKDRASGDRTPTVPEIVRLSLCGMVFDRGGSWSQLHATGGEKSASPPKKHDLAHPHKVEVGRELLPDDLGHVHSTFSDWR